MTGINPSQAASAYQNAARAAKELMEDTTLPGAATQAPTATNSFEALVGEALDNARDTAYMAEAISTKGLAGKADLSEVAAAVANAETSLNTVVAVRDRMISAYQDIIRMPI
jgi:flagellar hook-basal body complex protein FliE